MKLDFKKWLLILVGSLSWSFTMVKSGLFYSSLGKNGPGLGFWGANGHDGIWHIALASSLGSASFSMPIFSGYNIQNYHIGFDLALALISRITLIPVVNLYFQVLPVIFSFLIGVLTFEFVEDWQKSKKAAFWSVFFVYFGGSLGWLIGKGESTFWSQQAISTLINPPFAMSLAFILSGMILINSLKKKFSAWKLILCLILFGTLIEIKIYAGLLILGGLFTASIFEAIFKKEYLYLLIFAGTLIISMVLYFGFEKGSQSLIVFQPFWYLETLMGLGDRLNWTRFYSAMLTYRSGHVWIKAGLAYLVAFVIFVLGNFGTRIAVIFKKVKFDGINVLIYSIICAGILIPMLFLQKGTPWNTIQFFYYSLFFSSILAGGVLTKINSKIVLALIVLATIPTTILTLEQVYFPARPPSMIGQQELEALYFLAKQPRGVVLTQPFDQSKADAAIVNPPRPLYLYASTAYVSAFSGHQTFLEDEINLDIMGYPWKTRRQEEFDWFKSPNRNFLLANGIKYIYWIKMGQPPLDLGKLGILNVYENGLVTIYQVE